MSESIINVMKIVRGTTVDGPGLRTSVYLAGCPHHCPGCHNPSTWSENAGTPMTVSQIVEEVSRERLDVTLTGGDPLMHPAAVRTLAAEFRKCGLSVWLYTGYTWEEISDDETLYGALADIDVIVEGPFIHHLRNTDLLFRGSSNQRILALDHSGHRPSAKAWHDPLDDITF